MDWLCDLFKVIHLTNIIIETREKGWVHRNCLPNTQGFTLFKRSSLKTNGSCIVCRLSVFVRFKINNAPGTFFSFLSAITHNFTFHKTLFQTRLLPRLILPSHILNVECCRRKKKNKGSGLQYGHNINKLWVSDPSSASQDSEKLVVYLKGL